MKVSDMKGLYKLPFADRLEIAADPNTSAEDLVEMSWDPLPTVRNKVTKNPSAPLEALKKLQGDADADTRRTATENLSRQGLA